MARCMERNQTKLADPQHVTVPERMMFHAVTVRLLIVKTQSKLRANRFSKSERTGDEISMDVSLGHVLDVHALLCRVLRVAVEVAHRIDDDGFTFRREDVRILRQSWNFKLLHLHRFACPCFPASSSNSRRLFSASLLHTRAHSLKTMGSLMA